MLFGTIAADEKTSVWMHVVSPTRAAMTTLNVIPVSMSDLITDPENLCSMRYLIRPKSGVDNKRRLAARPITAMDGFPHKNLSGTLARLPYKRPRAPDSSQH